jgi:hypothetical protein
MLHSFAPQTRLAGAFALPTAIHISLLTHAIDHVLLVIIAIALLLNILAAISISRGWKLTARKVRQTESLLTFPALSQQILLSLFFVPMAMLLAHQRFVASLGLHSFDAFAWLWIINGIVWLFIPILTWPGAVLLEEFGLRQSTLMPAGKYIPYDEIAEIRWRQLNILIISKTGEKIVHTQFHSDRTLFEDELIARTKAEATALHWED